MIIKITNLKYEFDNDDITILPLSDIHVGDHNCNYKLLQKFIDYIAKNDNVYTVLNGDIFNQAIKSSVSFEHGATNPEDEYYQALELFKPIKDKILMITLGNHDDRVERQTGIDILRLWCRDLGVEDRYVRYGGVLQVKINRLKRNKYYRMYFTHGTGLGGGRTQGAKINAVKRLAEVITNCDLYCIGHVHTPSVVSDNIFYLDDKHNNIKTLTRHFCITGSLLDYGRYGQKFNYSPTSQEPLVIKIDDRLSATIGGV